MIKIVILYSEVYLDYIPDITKLALLLLIVQYEPPTLPYVLMLFMINLQHAFHPYETKPTHGSPLQWRLYIVKERRA